MRSLTALTATALLAAASTTAFAQTASAESAATAPTTHAAHAAPADGSASGHRPHWASATLRDADGDRVGKAVFRQKGDAVEVSVRAKGLETGFHGLHIHKVGVCEAPSAAPDDPSDTGAFLSAGGHWTLGDEKHPEHAGDLGQLYAGENSRARIVTWTDRFDVADLFDEDGSAVMIHSDPDNFANVPDRYAPDGPDEDTTGTGDAGSRAACGVVRH